MKSQIITNLAYSAAGIKDNTDNLCTAICAIIWTSYFNQVNRLSYLMKKIQKTLL